MYFQIYLNFGITVALQSLQFDDTPQEFSFQTLKFLYFLFLRGKEPVIVHHLPFFVTDYKGGTKMQIFA